jgi:hypothetical protein
MNRDVWLIWDIIVAKLGDGWLSWNRVATLVDGWLESDNNSKLDMDSCLGGYVRRKVAEFMR